MIDPEETKEEEEDQVHQAEEPEQFLSDAEADADALSSAGWGTDEDYGYFGKEDY